MTEIQRNDSSNSNMFSQNSLAVPASTQEPPTTEEKKDSSRQSQEVPFGSPIPTELHKIIQESEKSEVEEEIMQTPEVKKIDPREAYED